MTKSELEKCEKLCIEALKDIKESESLYEEAKKIDKDFHQATVPLRRADQKYGYALGINQVLASLGYESDSMKELTKLI